MPRKNIRLLGGKPLIAWTIEQANLAQSLDYFVISTEDAEIRTISNSILGYESDFVVQSGNRMTKGKVLQRPDNIADDCDTTLVLMHAVNWYERKHNKMVSHVVTLQPTSPFRNFHDIDECVHMAQITGADTIVSVKKVDEHPAWMFETDVFGRLKPFMENRLEGDVLISQNLPLLWFPNGAVYVTNRETLAAGRIFGNDMRPHHMPRERSVDLEEEIDFCRAEAYLKQYGNDFHVKVAPRTVVACDNG